MIFYVFIGFNLYNADTQMSIPVPEKYRGVCYCDLKPVDNIPTLNVRGWFVRIYPPHPDEPIEGYSPFFWGKPATFHNMDELFDGRFNQRSKF